jgi:hypothetical protein
MDLLGRASVPEHWIEAPDRKAGATFRGAGPSPSCFWQTSTHIFQRLVTRSDPDNRPDALLDPERLADAGQRLVRREWKAPKASLREQWTPNLWDKIPCERYPRKCSDYDVA